MCSIICKPKPCRRYWSRPRWPRRSSPPAGAGTPTAPWRYCAFWAARKFQRIRSDDLLASVFPDVAACQENIVGDIQIPDHPLVREVMKDVLTEAMDIDGLRAVLAGIRDGRIRCLAVDTPV